MNLVEPYTSSNRSHVGQCIKVWWMAFWRFNFFAAFFLPTPTPDILFTIWLLASTFAIVLVLLLGHTVRTFPLFNMLRGRAPLIRFRRPSPSARRPLLPGQQPVALPGSTWPTSAPQAAPRLDRATGKGRMTGYEPKTLASIEIQKSPWIIGNPGFGLGSSGFDATSVKLGQQGEQNFARALKKCGLIDRFQSFWSCAMPSAHGLYRDPQFDTDVDCILFNGKTVYLVDLKNYKGGAVTYKEKAGSLICVDDGTQQQLAISAKRSRNMQMALERFRKHFYGTGIAIEARVVFMPTDAGVGRIQNVYWPDRIPALYLDDFLQELSRSAGFTASKHHEWAGAQLRGLVKRW